MINGYQVFGDAAAAAVRQWVYAPAVSKGKPVPALVEETVTFMQ
jgi:hypothetical protein